MIRINLLPFRAARKKENIRAQVYMYLLGLFIILFALYLFNNSLANRIQELKDGIAKAKDKVAMYNRKAQQVEEMKKELALLEQKLEVIDRLNTNRDEAFNLFDGLFTTLVDRRMWFTRLDVREAAPKAAAPAKKKRKKKGKKAKEEPDPDKMKARPITIKISGVALDDKTVADYMTSLEESKLFTNVKLVTLILYQIKEKNINLKKFEIICQKEMPKAAKPTDTKEKAG